jgi:hypothetical protein
MSRLPRTLEYVAFTGAGTLSAAHAYLAYLMGEEAIALSKPLEFIAAPGVVAGWAVWDSIEDLWAPFLGIPISKLAPDGASELEPTRALYHVRFKSAAKQVPCAGYAVTRIRQGTWVEIVDRDAWLASLGLRVMPEVGVEGQPARHALLSAAHALEDARTAPSLTECRARMQAEIDATFAALGLPASEIRRRWAVPQSIAEVVQGSTS